MDAIKKLNASILGYGPFSLPSTFVELGEWFASPRFASWHSIVRPNRTPMLIIKDDCTMLRVRRNSDGIAWPGDPGITIQHRPGISIVHTSLDVELANLHSYLAAGEVRGWLSAIHAHGGRLQVPGIHGEISFFRV